MAAEEKELVGWAESAGEASSSGTGAPLVEDVVDESTEEEAGVNVKTAGSRVGGPELCV